MMSKDQNQSDLNLQPEATPKGAMECLGISFPNDEERRKYFLEKLRKKLKDPEFRKIDGFPIGSDEDILVLSDPPYYTACPNPFIEDFIKKYGKLYDPNEPYRREPFATDVSEGRNDPIYNAHSYHTKVPHKAIMRYILHYTEPGDVVFDGFCGTGMTGIAAQLCGDRTTVESLGYKVEDSTIYQPETDQNGKTFWKPFSKLGTRWAILNDLSSAATFIAHNYNTPVEVKALESEAKRLLKVVEDELCWMYQTNHSDSKTACEINYAVWSDVFVCPDCSGEVVFWDVAVDQDNGVVRPEFKCPSCTSILSKRSLDRAFLTFHDHALGIPVRQAKQIPVLYNYKHAGRTYTKQPDARDLNLLARINALEPRDWFPSVRMPEGDESRRNDDAGITHAHHFYTKRNRLTLARLFAECPTSLCKWLITGIMQRSSKQHQIAISRVGGPKEGEGGATAGHRRGTLYIPSNQIEFNPFLLIPERLKMALKAAKRPWIGRNNSIIETASTTQTRIEENQIDYIFTDPPFGGNIMYSELNFIWESALKVRTNSDQEAITNKTQKKALLDYQMIMFRCFSEYFRTLKPGHWMTVEFHNTQNAVWSSIQEALQRAGFVVADVRVLDKKIKTHTQRTAGGSVNKDLAITAYKPNGGLEDRFRLEAGTEDGAWDFIRTHLRQLPVFVSKDGRAGVIAERQNFLLFDRMVAFHVQRGVTVPLSASEFYAGLEQRFPPRDGMYFLPEQVAEYDKRRMTVREVLQLELFVSDESSAIQWLRQQLTRKPQSAGDLKPQFMQEIGGWQKTERLLELDELLEQNFLRYDGKAEVPSQIHSYLSTNFKELRNLSKDSESLRIRGKDRWYVPDPNKAGDLEKLRERALLKEFSDYLPPDFRPAKPDSQAGFIPGLEPKTVPIPRGKRMKVIRLEAVRAGFKYCWQNRDYRTIIAVAQRVPENVLQEDPKLLMWYDQAVTRTGEAQ